MRTEIFMEGVQLDITQDISALFTYAIDDIRDFGSRNTNFSKTISIPGNSRNNALFGHAFEFTCFNPHNPAAPNVGANFNAARSAKALVFVDGIQVFKGVIRLMEIVYLEGYVTYECAVFGELGGLIADIGNKLLSDLDFSEYDKAWTAANIVASWAPYGAVFFPLVDYGGVGSGTGGKHDWNYTAFRPAIRVYEYMVRIMLTARGGAYKWDAPFFGTTFFTRQYVPHNEDKVYKFIKLLLEQRLGSMIPYFMQSGLNGPAPAVLTNKVAFTSGLINNFTANTNVDEFTYNTGLDPISGTLTYSVSGLYVGGNNQRRARFYVEVNGVTLRQHDVILSGVTTNVAYPFSFSGTLNNVYVAAGYVIRVRAETISSGAANFKIEPNSALLKFESNTAQFAPAALGDTLQMNYMIPKGVTQRDFFVSIIKMFNLYVIEDTNDSRSLIIRPYPSFHDLSDRVDWTDKIDWSKEIRLKPMSEINARYYHFLYEKDTDYYNENYRTNIGEGYGDYVFDAGQTQGLDFVKDKKELKVIFAGSPMRGIPGEDKYWTPIYKSDGSTEEPTGSKIRILSVKRITGVSSWAIKNGGITLGTYTTYGYAGHLDNPTAPTTDLNFGAPKAVYRPFTVAYPSANLFNVFYSAYMAEVCDKDSKLLSCYLRITPKDIHNLEFRKGYIIGGALWRLHKVEDYDTGQEGTIRCEFLKVINISY